MALPPRPSTPAKHTKTEAKYGAGMPKAHCGICRHFLTPNACRIVSGVVAPSSWCKYFQR